jgi:general secretion pathway protein L
MGRTIVGLDLGTYSVKAYRIDTSNDFDGPEFWEQKVVYSGTDAQPDSVQPDGEGVGEDEPTAIRPAPNPPAAREGSTGVEEDHDAIQAAVAELANRGVFENAHRIVVNVPGDDGLLFTMPVPFSDKKRVGQILGPMLQDELPFELSHVVWDYQVYEEPDTTGVAVVGCVRTARLESLLFGLQANGIDPAIVTPSETALVPAVLSSSPEEIVAAVDLGHRTIRVVVLDGEKPIMARTILRGGSELNEAIATAFGVDLLEAERIKEQHAALVDASMTPTDDLMRLSEVITKAMRPWVRELRRTFQGLYVKGGSEVAKIVLCGGTSCIANIAPYLQRELGVATQILTVPTISDVDSARTGQHALVYGLAALEYPESRTDVLDLRQPPYAYRGRSIVLRRELTKLAVAAVLLVGLMAGAMFAEQTAKSARRDAMQQSLEDQTERLFGVKMTKKTDIARFLEGQDGSARDFIPSVSAFELTYDLVSKMSDEIEVSLTRLDVDVDRKLIQVFGVTTDAQAVDQLVFDLGQIECLKEIKKNKLKVKNEEKAEFELQITSECT